jgi:hypothetical protein
VDRQETTHDKDVVDKLKFWIVSAELVMDAVSTCPNCENCRKLAKQYLENVESTGG